MNITKNPNIFCCNDACNTDVTASNGYDNNIIRVKKLFIVFIYLIGDFINVFLFSSPFFSFHLYFFYFL